MSSNRRRHQKIRERHYDRMRARFGPDWEPTRCRFCTDARGHGPDVRTVDVVLPPDPTMKRGWRVVRLPIDLWPHPDGDVIKDNGGFRKLTDLADADPGQARFRIHSALTCAGITNEATG